MIRRTIIALVGAAMLAAPGEAQTRPQAPPTLATVPADIVALTPKITTLFETYMRDQHIPGLVYGIVVGGKLVLVRGIGVQDLDARRPVTAATRFRVASMSKAFTALAILDLRDAGNLSLDAPAETYVPEMRGWKYPTADSPKVRVRDLLNHIAGFVTDDPWGDRQQVLPEADFTRMLSAGVPFSRPPQTAMEYSNFGYATLGRIVTNVSGEPFEAYIAGRILTPLGMVHTGYDYTTAPTETRALGYRWENEAFAREPDMRRGAFGAMGGVQTNATDYARYVAWLLAAWPPRDDRDPGPLKRATIREIAQGSNFMATGKGPGRGAANGCLQAQAYGMGWRVAQDCALGRTLSHGGGYPGYGSHVLLLPEFGVGIFAFANRTYAGPSAPVWDAARLLGEAGLLRPRTLPVTPALAAAYQATRAAYAAGSIAPFGTGLAMNVLMDRSAGNWRAEFARLHAAVGACPDANPLTPVSAMEAGFRWTCQRGTIEGSIVLAPTRPATLQALDFRVVLPTP